MIKSRYLIACLLCLFLFSCTAQAEEMITEENYANKNLTMRPNDRLDTGYVGAEWSSDAPEVAQMTPEGTILTYDIGFATLIGVYADGNEEHIDITVTQDAPPALIHSAIALALREWEENLGNTFTQRNKYTAWYCGTGPKCYFGWCGGFVSYCLDTAGVPMDEPNDSVPHESGEPYAVFAAGVGKILTGFTKMERVTSIPKPGYLVIYGQRNRYNTIHIGMITDVTDLENGIYSICTVEGNVSNRIKRYNYFYDSLDETEHNMMEPPESWQTDPDIYQYKVHQDDWFVYAFCQTWF